MADDARLVGAERVAVVGDDGLEGGLDVVVGAARDSMDGDGDEAATEMDREALGDADVLEGRGKESGTRVPEREADAEDAKVASSILFDGEHRVDGVPIVAAGESLFVSAVHEHAV